MALTVVLAAALVGCSTPTPYQPKVPGKASSAGYAEMQIEPNRWRVTFAGNTLTSRQTVEGYLLFRAAELTTQQGFDWFSIVDRDTQTHTRTYIDSYSPWYGPGYGYWRPYWRYWGGGYGWHSWDPYWGGPFWADSIDVRTYEKFEAAAEIYMGRGAKPAEDPRAFDARQVIANLQPRIQYPAPAKQ